MPSAYRTCPVRISGRARTNLGRAAGHGLFAAVHQSKWSNREWSNHGRWCRRGCARARSRPSGGETNSAHTRQSRPDFGLVIGSRSYRLGCVRASGLGRRIDGRVWGRVLQWSTAGWCVLERRTDGGVFVSGGAAWAARGRDRGHRKARRL